jgi:DNA/RNA endonuclease YhcR with UshA esterase domain
MSINFGTIDLVIIRHSSKEIGTKEYFEEVTKRKYIVEPHIIDFANLKSIKIKRY